MSDETTVYLTTARTGTNGYYHVDADCRQLDRASNVRERPLHLIPDHYRRCRVCDPDHISPNTGRGDGHYEALVEADPDDLIADGGVPEGHEPVDHPGLTPWGPIGEALCIVALGYLVAIAIGLVIAGGWW